MLGRRYRPPSLPPPHPTPISAAQPPSPARPAVRKHCKTFCEAICRVWDHLPVHSKHAPHTQASLPLAPRTELRCTLAIGKQAASPKPKPQVRSPPCGVTGPLESSCTRPGRLRVLCGQQGSRQGEAASLNGTAPPPLAARLRQMQRRPPQQLRLTSAVLMDAPPCPCSTAPLSRRAATATAPWRTRPTPRSTAGSTRAPTRSPASNSTSTPREPSSTTIPVRARVARERGGAGGRGRRRPCMPLAGRAAGCGAEAAWAALGCPRVPRRAPPTLPPRTHPPPVRHSHRHGEDEHGAPDAGQHPGVPP